MWKGRVGVACPRTHISSNDSKRLSGRHGGRGECYHILAARRRGDERRAQWQAAYERDTRAGGYGYNDTLNLMFGTQAASGY